MSPVQKSNTSSVSSCCSSWKSCFQFCRDCHETVSPWFWSAWTPEGKVGPNPASAVGPFGCDRSVPPGCCQRIFPLCSCATVYSYEGVSPLFCALLLMTCHPFDVFLAPLLHLILFMFWTPPIHGIHYNSDGMILTVNAEGVRVPLVGLPIVSDAHAAAPIGASKMRVEMVESDSGECFVVSMDQ